MATPSLRSRCISFASRLPAKQPVQRVPPFAARGGARRYVASQQARYLSASTVDGVLRPYLADAGALAGPNGDIPSGVSRLRTALFLGAGGVAFAAAGFLTALYSTLPASLLGLEFLSDESSRHAFAPSDEEAKRIEEYIDSHPLAKRLRETPGLTESRPHLKMPEVIRRQSLTAGALADSRKIGVPPFAWRDGNGRKMVSIIYIGPDLCGHPGIVHGGLLATLLDEGFAGCCFAALPHKIGVTANLQIDYRSPAPAGQYYVLSAETTKVEGRKAWVEGRLQTLVPEGEKPTTVAEAKGLFISPRNAALMPKLNP